MAVHVVNEARRCLHCKKPMCREGCPIGTNIPEVNELFRTGHKEEAGAMLYENNPLSVICSLVCDHDKQCEGHCILGKKGSPVHFSSIENYISDAYLDHLPAKPVSGSGQRVAIIGSGPAGITISVLLAQRGYRVTLFESKERIGGVLRYGIPDFRLPKTILDRYQKQLTAMGIPGESLGNVAFAINYLVNPDVYDLGNQLVVIGAGNTAMDVARTALRKGVRHVNVFCRSNHPAASAREIDYAEADGVVFHYGMRPTRITDEGVFYRKATLDENGNVLQLSEEQFYPCSSVIIAISQGAQNRIVSTTTGLQMSSHGLLATDEHGHTTREGVFASGDVVLGARTVVEAVRYSKQVADEMDAYLRSRRES